MAEAPQSTPEAPEHLRRKMREHGARLAGERKQVTVLFADVMGSMDLAEQLDPERWREIMDGLFQRLAGAVHRFEGTVDKFTGDGIMALFGAPIAHEDHAQRACFAALQMLEGAGEYAAELRRTEGISLSLRIGVNSGEVVVGEIGDEGSLSYTAVGHTVGLAQRMEALAEPGRAYVTDHTARLAAGFLELDDLGEFEIKGSSRPLRVHALAGTGSARGRLDVSRRRGFSRFVGRADEMARLEGALEQVAGGEGQAVGIVGEAGVGKSRLCHEFAERCRARGIAVYEAQCQAHGRDLPLLPVLQMLRAYFGIEPADSERETREKIAGRLLLLDASFADDLGLVFDFLAVPDPQRPAPQMNPEARQRRLLELVGRIVCARGREEPAVNLIEDLHWVDPASEAFLHALIAAAPGTGTLVVANFRPEYRERWPGHPHSQRLSLEPLGPEALGELLSELLGEDPSLDGLAELIRERTGGNPFFIEEMVRELAESGALEGERGGYRLVREIGELAVPPTVQAILAARIDRLGASAKAALQAASAVGGEFRRDLLGHAVELDGDGLDGALSELVASEFVCESALYPVPEYCFCHPLTREVAYGSQLAAARGRVHAAIARGIQEVEPDRLEENAALVAHHFEQAGEALEAARWHARAAGWAGFNDPAAALGHWERVRALDGELPEGEEADGLRLGSRLYIVGIGWRLGADFENQRQVYEEGKAIAERTGNRGALALLHGGFGLTVGTCGGDMQGYERLGDEAARTAEEVDDPALKIGGLLVPVYSRWVAGRHLESLEAVDRILELTEEDPRLGAGITVTNPRAWSTSFRAPPLMALGRFAEARAALADGAELCRRWDRESLGWTYMFQCAIVLWGGEPAGPETLAHARQAVEIAERIGDAFSRSGAIGWLGMAHALCGEHDEAAPHLDRALELIAERRANLEFEPGLRSFRAERFAARGEMDEAVAEADLVLRLAEERAVVAYLPRMRETAARLLIARGGADDLDRAGALLDEAEELARRLGQRPDVARAGIVRAQLCEASGDAEGAERERAAALELAQEVDARGLMAELEPEGATA